MIQLSEIQEKLKLDFSEFSNNKIAPFAKNNDINETLDGSIVKSMVEEGYLGSMIPEEYGGRGFDSVTIGLLNEEVGKVCSATRSLLTVHGMVAIAINKWGTLAQKELWLPKLAKGEVIGAFALTEPEAGSDANSMKSIALEDGNNYSISGEKKWITMGQIANVFLVFAKVEDKATAFLIPRNTKGVTVKAITGLLGVRGSMLAELKFDNCIIPKEYMIGREGFGLSHVGLFSLDYGRYTIACGCVGLAQGCLDESINYAKERTQFKVPLGNHQLVQKMITEMVVNIKAARLLCFNAGRLRDEGDPASIMETWCAKYFASKMVNDVSNNAVQIFGAKGLSNEYPIEQYFRDARVNEIIEGSSQIHESLIAKNMLNNWRK
jgi:glutaryl-CoA dehydrogenase (non-decarboxylating)